MLRKYLASFYDESFLYHDSILKKNILKLASYVVYLYRRNSGRFSGRVLGKMLI